MSSTARTAPSSPITVPDTASHFGSYDAQVWLPPQYFSDSAPALPGGLLLHGNPGANNRLADLRPSGASTGLSVAQAGKPVILVMPERLRDGFTGDSLCVDTQSQGNAETYLTKDVIAAIDSQFRTITNAKGRAIGGMSMGGYCALNLGLKHPDIYSVVLDFSGETVSRAGPPAGWQPGPLRRLGLAAEGRREQPREVLHARSTAARARPSGWTWAPRTAILAADAGRCRQAQGQGIHRGVPHPPGGPRLDYLDGGAQGRAALGGAADDGAHPADTGNPHHPARR